MADDSDAKGCAGNLEECMKNAALYDFVTLPVDKDLCKRACGMAFECKAYQVNEADGTCNTWASLAKADESTPDAKCNIKDLYDAADPKYQKFVT